MGWFNLFGLLILAVMMIPNIIEAKIHPEHFRNRFTDRTLEIFEQTGRIGSFALMVFNIPGLFRGFWFEGARTVYLSVNGFLLVVYLLGWAVMKKRDPVARACLLSVTPSLIFVFSGVMLLSYPLIVFSMVFAVCHILISVKNAALSEK